LKHALAMTPTKLDHGPSSSGNWSDVNVRSPLIVLKKSG
jgi:hypothetical protein